MTQPDMSLRIRAALQKETPFNVRNFSVTGPIHQGPYGTIFYAEGPNLPYQLVVKVCMDPDGGKPDPIFCERQFYAMRSAYFRMLPSPDYRIPKPILFLPDYAALVMEKINGKTFSEYLVAWDCGRDELLCLVARSARWLAHFHRSSPPDYARLETDTIQGRLRTIIDSGQFDPVSLRVLKNAVRGLRVASAKVDEIELQTTFTHDDFRPGNIIFTESKVYGIDICYSKRSIYLEDIAMFLNAVDTLLLLPKGLHRCGEMAKITEQFLKGYMGNGKFTHSTPLLWLRITDMIEFFARFHSEGRTTLHNWYFRAMSMYLVGRLSRQLNRDICV